MWWFYVYGTESLGSRVPCLFYRKFELGIGIVELLDDTNIVALVGGGDHPAFPTNRVVVWNHASHQPVRQIEYTHEVKSVKLLKYNDTAIILVILLNKAYVYDLRVSQFILQFDITNPHSVGVMFNTQEGPLIVLSTVINGSGQLVFQNFSNPASRGDIIAHKGPIKAIAVCPDGSHVATASEHGTLIRVWETAHFTPIKELRRGSYQAEILSLAINPPLLVSASCRAGVRKCHLFAIASEEAMCVAFPTFIGSLIKFPIN
ncbi:WD repeat domain phosphoinositide-interacting protein 3 [Pelomyxa schiedti]|nr:WD repeat domain phosphoinositide-interacting protein 3 [Pelomyxa schiedti]